MRLRRARLVRVMHRGVQMPRYALVRDLGMLPQRDRVIGDRNDRERADHEREAKPDQAIP